MGFTCCQYSARGGGMIPLINLREIDKKRLRNLKDRVETNLKSEDIWFVHTVLAQCFLPYHDPKTERWHKKNGAFSILLTAGAIEDKESFRVLGLPFGCKTSTLPELYVHTGYQTSVSCHPC